MGDTETERCRERNRETEKHRDRETERGRKREKMGDRNRKRRRETEGDVSKVSYIWEFRYALFHSGMIKVIASN